MFLQEIIECRLCNRSSSVLLLTWFWIRFRWARLWTFFRTWRHLRRWRWFHYIDFLRHFIYLPSLRLLLYNDFLFIDNLLNFFLDLNFFGGSFQFSFLFKNLKWFRFKLLWSSEQHRLTNQPSNLAIRRQKVSIFRRQIQQLTDYLTSEFVFKLAMDNLQQFEYSCTAVIELNQSLTQIGLEFRFK